jgi:hypothetical protein
MLQVTLIQTQLYSNRIKWPKTYITTFLALLLRGKGNKVDNLYTTQHLCFTVKHLSMNVLLTEHNRNRNSLIIRFGLYWHLWQFIAQNCYVNEICTYWTRLKMRDAILNVF